MKLVPYITYAGEARQALDFYKDCLKGEIIAMGTYGESQMDTKEEDKDKVMHAVFSFGDNQIMISDSMKAESSPADSNIQLSVDAPDMEEMELVFNKLAEGGTITMPLQDTFWGARFGMLKDKFGIKWMFNHDIKPKEGAE